MSSVKTHDVLGALYGKHAEFAHSSERVCVYTSVFVCTCVYARVRVCMHVFVCACVRMCRCVCVYAEDFCQCQRY